ncbi:MAG TPA: hypothetical protein VFH68_00360 [Polyangia bacterium]|jgi:hypothetical protein|nr:hypothetical protein [Polyangia bacterium]
MIHGAHVIIRPGADRRDEGEKVECSPIDERLTLPGGGKLGVYQPKHASPLKAGAT